MLIFDRASAAQRQPAYINMNLQNVTAHIGRIVDLKILVIADIVIIVMMVSW